MTTNRHLQLPEGVERAYLEHSRRHRRLLAKIHRVYDLAGYLPIDTPILDYLDSYSHLLTPEDVRKAYTLAGRDGDLLLLRPDITLFLAKQLAGTVRPTDLPARVCYSDFIVRPVDAEEISTKEFFQTGVELVGKPGIDGDLEALSLLIEVLNAVGLQDYAVHIGSRALFDALVPPDQRAELSEAVHDRRFVYSGVSVGAGGSASAAADGGASGEAAPALFSILTQAADGEALVEELGRADAVPGAALEEARRVAATARRVASVFPGADVRLDLSEIGAQSYYTGIVFRVFAPGIGSAVASGGRYDDLLSSFGFPAESVGFSVMLRRIETGTEVGAEPAPHRATGSDFETAYAKATTLRREGKAAVLG